MDTNIKSLNAQESKKLSDKEFSRIALSDYINEISFIDLQIADAVMSGYGSVYIFKNAINGYENKYRFLEKYYEKLGYSFWVGSQNLLFALTWDGKGLTKSPDEKYKPLKQE